MKLIEKQAIQNVVLAMAYNRETFKDKVEEYIRGAYLEFYKARLASKNGETIWIEHWMTEVHRLLDYSLYAALKHFIKGFNDRDKAVKEVVMALKKEDAAYRRIAEHIIKKDYNIKKIRYKLDDSDTTMFWTKVKKVVKNALKLTY